MTKIINIPKQEYEEILLEENKRLKNIENNLCSQKERKEIRKLLKITKLYKNECEENEIKMEKMIDSVIENAKKGNGKKLEETDFYKELSK